MNPATTAPGLATAKIPRSKLFAPRGVFFFAVLTLWLAATALAPAHAQSGKRIAFLIGNAKYEGESTLANPHNDAALLAGVFKNDLRFDEVVQHRDLNRKQMYDLVREVARKSKGADSVVVYYSGHGMRGSGGNYLIPTDARIADEDDVRRDALAATDLVDALQASNARVALLILDACRDSPYSKRTKSASKGLARMGVTSGNMLVAYATSEGSTADDGRGSNSPYAQALAQHLRNTSQPLLSQFDAVRRSVREATGNKQNPTREGDLETSVYLLASVVPERSAAPLPTSPSAAELEQQAWDAAKASNSEAGFRAYLREYPQGRFASAARVAIVSVRPAPGSQPAPTPVAQALRPISSIPMVENSLGTLVLTDTLYGGKRTMEIFITQTKNEKTVYSSGDSISTDGRVLQARMGNAVLRLISGALWTIPLKVGTSGEAVIEQVDVPYRSTGTVKWKAMAAADGRIKVDAQVSYQVQGMDAVYTTAFGNWSATYGDKQKLPDFSSSAFRGRFVTGPNGGTDVNNIFSAEFKAR